MAATIMAVVVFYAQVVAPPLLQASFWEERRLVVQRARGQGGGGGHKELFRGDARFASSLHGGLIAKAFLSSSRVPPTATPAPSFTLPGSATEAPATQPLGPPPRSSLPSAPSRSSWVTELARAIGPYATIRETHLAPGHHIPLIIHIQDLHGHVEVQRNIAKVIEVLQRQSDHSLLVGVEGAVGESLLDFYRAFPDKVLNLDIADYFLKEGLITGAEYAGMTADPAPLLWGVEDANLYRAHVQTYRQLLPEQSKFKEILSHLKTQMKQWKESHYPPSLKALDDRMETYHSSRLPLGQYVQFLAAQWDATSKGPNDSHPLPYPNMAHFLQALTLEPSLDFAHVSRGQERFRQYVDLVRGLKTHTLFDELDQLEDAVVERTATDSTQRALHQLTKHLYLVDKLANQRLGRQEWASYQTHQVEIHQLPQRLQALCTAADADRLKRVLKDFSSLVMEFEQFYTLASHRDYTLLKNFLGKLVESKDPQALIVTGGFHTQGVTERLRREGFSYVVVTPRLATLDPSHDPLAALRQDRLPWERLFLGEPLSLPQELRTFSTINLQKASALAQLAFVFQTIKGLFTQQADNQNRYGSADDRAQFIPMQMAQAVLSETQRLAARALPPPSSLPFDPYAFQVLRANLTDTHSWDITLRTPQSVVALTAQDPGTTATRPATTPPVLLATFLPSHLKIELRKGEIPEGFQPPRELSSSHQATRSAMGLLPTDLQRGWLLVGQNPSLWLMAGMVFLLVSVALIPLIVHGRDSKEEKTNGFILPILVLALFALGVLGLPPALDPRLLPVVQATALTKEIELCFENRLVERGVTERRSQKPGIQLLRAIYGLEGEPALQVHLPDGHRAADGTRLEFLADLVAPMLHTLVRSGIYPDGLEDPVLILFLWSLGLSRLGLSPPSEYDALLRLMDQYGRIDPYPRHWSPDGLKLRHLYFFKSGKDSTHVPNVYVFENKRTDPTRPGGVRYDFTHLGSSPNPRWSLSSEELTRTIPRGDLSSLHAIPAQQQHDEKEEGSPPQVLELGSRKEIANAMEAAYKEINTWWVEQDIAQLKTQLVKLRTSPFLHSAILEDYVILVLNRIASDRNVPNTKRQEAAIAALEYWLKVVISPDVKRTIETILTKLQGEAAAAYVPERFQPLGKQLIQSLDPLGGKPSKRPTKKTGGPVVHSPFEEALTVGDEAKRQQAERFLRLLDLKMVGDDQVNQLTSSVIGGIERLRTLTAQQRPPLERRVSYALGALISLFYRSDMGEQQLEALKTELKQRELTDVLHDLTTMLEKAGKRWKRLHAIPQATSDPEWWLAYHRMMLNQMPSVPVSTPTRALRQTTAPGGKTNAGFLLDVSLAFSLLGLDPWLMVSGVFFWASALLLMLLMVHQKDSKKRRSDGSGSLPTVTVRIPLALRWATEGKETMQLQGRTLQEAIKGLTDFPRLREELLSRQASTGFYKNTQKVTLNEPLTSDDVVTIIPGISATPPTDDQRGIAKLRHEWRTLMNSVCKDPEHPRESETFQRHPAYKIVKATEWLALAGDGDALGQLWLFARAKDWPALRKWTVEALGRVGNHEQVVTMSHVAMERSEMPSPHPWVFSPWIVDRRFPAAYEELAEVLNHREIMQPVQGMGGDTRNLVLGPVADPRGQRPSTHGRSLARGGHIFKGIGLPKGVVVKDGFQVAFEPYRQQAELGIGGGVTEEHAENMAAYAMALRNALEEAEQHKATPLTLAHAAGVGFDSSFLLQVVGVYRPIALPVFIPNPSLLSEGARKLVAEETPGAFPGVQLDHGIHWIKTAPLMKFLNIPHEPVIIHYTSEALTRLNELGPLSQDPEGWAPFFRHYGFSLKPTPGSVQVIRLAEGKEVPLAEASHVVLRGMAVWLGVFLYLLHDGLHGSARSDAGNVLNEDNLNPLGPFDFADLDIGIGYSQSRQEDDIRMALTRLEQTARLLRLSTPTTWEAQALFMRILAGDRSAFDALPKPPLVVDSQGSEKDGPTTARGFIFLSFSFQGGGLSLLIMAVLGGAILKMIRWYQAWESRRQDMDRYIFPLADPQGVLGPLAGYRDRRLPIPSSNHLDLAALLGGGIPPMIQEQPTPTAEVIPPVRGVLEGYQQHLSRQRVVASQL